MSAPFEAIVVGIQLDPGAVGVRVQCMACSHCGKSGVVDIDEDEYAWLSQGVSPAKALSARDNVFRELFITGIHEHCWESIFECGEDEDD